MLQQLGNGMGARRSLHRCRLRRSPLQKFSDGRSIPCTLDRHRPISLGNFLAPVHHLAPNGLPLSATHFTSSFCCLFASPARRATRQPFCSCLCYTSPMKTTILGVSCLLLLAAT